MTDDSEASSRDPHRGVLVAVMIAVFLAAVDQTIVSTALPRIAADLGDTKLYAWVFTAYMVSTTIFTPISGSIGDLHGRRKVLLFGLATFTLGSFLAGTATSMQALIAYRALLGVGAGVLTSNAFALLGDIYSLEKMARATGLMSGVYGLAGAFGPVMGGVLTDHFGWRSIFFVNVPACLAVGAVLFARLPKKVATSEHPLDWLGALLMAATLLPALLALSWAGEGMAPSSPRMLFAMAAALVFGAGFVVAEKRAVRPILAFELFATPTFSVAMAAMFGIALAMHAAISFAPMFFQAHMGMTPSRSGLVTAPLVLTLAVMAGVAGRLMGNGVGYRALCASGVLVAAGALAWLSALRPDSGAAVAATTMATLGAGLGLTMPTLMLAAQRAVPEGHLGVTAALSKFFRAIGGLIGVVVSGALVRHFESALGDRGAALSQMTLCAAGAMAATVLLTWMLPATAAAQADAGFTGGAKSPRP